MHRYSLEVLLIHDILTHFWRLWSLYALTHGTSGYHGMYKTLSRFLLETQLFFPARRKEQLEVSVSLQSHKELLKH